MGAGRAEVLAMRCGEIFFGAWWDEGFWCFCRGFWGGRGNWMWFFDGVTVVECVVNVVF